MSQMFQFHTRVVSGTLGRMPLCSFLFQTQCEVFNCNILCNYNGYKAYMVLIHPHPVLGSRDFTGEQRYVDCTQLTHSEMGSRAGVQEPAGAQCPSLWCWPWLSPFLTLESKLKWWPSGKAKSRGYHPQAPPLLCPALSSSAETRKALAEC